jgi:hypothetical protein
MSCDEPLQATRLSTRKMVRHQHVNAIRSCRNQLFKVRGKTKQLAAQLSAASVQLCIRSCNSPNRPVQTAAIDLVQVGPSHWNKHRQISPTCFSTDRGPPGSSELMLDQSLPANLMDWFLQLSAIFAIPGLWFVVPVRELASWTISRCATHRLQSTQPSVLVCQQSKWTLLTSNLLSPHCKRNIMEQNQRYF